VSPVPIEIGMQATGDCKEVVNPAPGCHTAGIAHQPRQFVRRFPEGAAGVDDAAIQSRVSAAVGDGQSAGNSGGNTLGGVGRRHSHRACLAAITR